MRPTRPATEEGLRFTQGSLIDRLPLSRAARGHLLALLSTAAIASIFVISKWSLNSLDTATFNTWWYGATILVAIVYQRARQRAGLVATFRAHRRWPIIVLGLISGLSTLLFFLAISLIDPAIAAFFDRSETLFAVLLGFVVFGERLTRLEFTGMVVLVGGTLVLTSASGQAAVLGAVLVFAANFLYAAGLALVKSQLGDMDTGALTGLRAVFGFPILIGHALIVGGWHIPEAGQLAGIFIGALLGSFIGHMLYYRSLQYIDLSKASLLHASQPLFVVVYGLLIFGTLPGVQQWFGGALVLLGVYLLLRGGRRIAKTVE